MKNFNVCLSLDDFNQIKSALVLYKSTFEKHGLKCLAYLRAISLIGLIDKVKSQSV